MGWTHTDNNGNVIVRDSEAIDVNVENHGTLFLFRLNTEAAKAWAEEHVAEDAQWLGGALAVEHRYALPLAEGMLEDGLAVE